MLSLILIDKCKLSINLLTSFLKHPF